jgi:hypothetical protein
MRTLEKSVSDEINRRIEQILSDGKRHPLSDFLGIGELVSEEVAQRAYITSMGENAAANKELGAVVFAGRRRILERRLCRLYHDGVVERWGTGFDKEFCIKASSGIEADIERAVSAVRREGRALKGDQFDLFLAAVRQRIGDVLKGRLVGNE